MWTHIYSPVSDTYTLQYKSCMPVSVSVLEDPSTHVQTLLYTHSSGRSQTFCSSEFVSFLNIADRICPCLSAGDTLIKSPYLQKHREASGGKWSKHVSLYVKVCWLCSVLWRLKGRGTTTLLEVLRSSFSVWISSKTALNVASALLHLCLGYIW